MFTPATFCEVENLLWKNKNEWAVQKWINFSAVIGEMIAVHVPYATSTACHMFVLNILESLGLKSTV